jgi:hypothetical protein
MAENITSNMDQKERKKLCIEEIKMIMEGIGPNCVNREQLRKKYHFDWHSVDKWYRNLLSSTPKEEINIIASKAELSICKALERCELIIVSPNTTTREKLMAIGMLFEGLKAQKDILEAYGRKAKTIEKIEIRETARSINQEIGEYKAIFEKLTPEEREKMDKVLFREEKYG